MPAGMDTINPIEQRMGQRLFNLRVWSAAAPKKNYLQNLSMRDFKALRGAPFYKDLSVP